MVDVHGVGSSYGAMQAAMELPAQYYSDAAILQRESNRLSPEVQAECARMWKKLSRWFQLGPNRGLNEAAYRIVFREFAKGIVFVPTSPQWRWLRGVVW